MANDNVVLITGASGHVGFRTLVLLLQHGYQAKVVLRSLSKVDEIRSNAAIKALNVTPARTAASYVNNIHINQPPEYLTFSEVPDMTIPDCFDEAVKNVRYICHIASPLASNADPNNTDFETTMIKPAIHGTTSMLEAAAKSPGVRRISITSSVFGFIPWQNMAAIESSTLFNHESRTPTPDHPPENPLAAYGHSKIAALNAAESWVKEHNPAFDLIHVHPNFVLGRNDLLTSFANATRGTNNNVLSIVLGDQTPATAPRGRFAGGSVHVDDVALIHVLSLDTDKVSGNQSFVANVECVWQDTTDIVNRDFPDAVKQGLVPNDGIKGTLPVKIDAKKTEEVLGFKFKSFEEQVQSVVDHYLELKRAGQGSTT